MVIKKLFISALCWLAICSLQAFAAATASVDRSTVGIDETFQLTLSLDESSMFDKPDISVLEKDFAILSQQKSSQSSWINGSKTATTEWLYQLAPKHTGIISIPAIEIDGQKTQPLTIKVSGTNNNNNMSGTNIKPVFMESVVDKKSLYVQEQLLLTLRINSSINLQNLQLQDLKIDNAFVVQVSNTSYQRSINNTPYITYEVVYAIFPQTSGELAIPSVEAAGINPGRSSFNSFFNSGTNMHLQSEPLSVMVNAIPAKVGNQLWLPAKNLHLSETWSADPENIKIGDSITRTITTTANGLSSEQLPTASMQADSHYKIYPDQPKTSDAKNNEGVVGERKDSITLVATQAGEVTLPAINVQWWDIAENTLKTETLPEVTIKIKSDGNSPAPQAAAPDTQTAVTAVTPSTLGETTSQPSAGTNPPPANCTTEQPLVWQIATGISSLVALVFMLLFVSARKKSQPNTTATEVPHENTSLKTALHNLESACKANSVTAIRLGILAWAKLAWPDARIHALSDIHLVCKDEAIKTWLNKVDACLYTGQQAQENWMELYRLIEQKQAGMKKDNDNILKPLYPV